MSWEGRGNAENFALGLTAIAGLEVPVVEEVDAALGGAGALGRVNFATPFDATALDLFFADVVVVGLEIGGVEIDAASGCAVATETPLLRAPAVRDFLLPEFADSGAAATIVRKLAK